MTPADFILLCYAAFAVLVMVAAGVTWCIQQIVQDTREMRALRERARQREADKRRYGRQGLR